MPQNTVLLILAWGGPQPKSQLLFQVCTHITRSALVSADSKLGTQHWSSQTSLAEKSIPFKPQYNLPFCRYCFPVASGTNDHNTLDLKQQKFIFSQSGGTEV